MSLFLSGLAPSPELAPTFLHGELRLFSLAPMNSLFPHSSGRFDHALNHVLTESCLAQGHNLPLRRDQVCSNVWQTRQRTCHFQRRGAGALGSGWSTETLPGVGIQLPACRSGGWDLPAPLRPLAQLAGAHPEDSPPEEPWGESSVILTNRPPGQTFASGCLVPWWSWVSRGAGTALGLGPTLPSALTLNTGTKKN